MALQTEDIKRTGATSRPHRPPPHPVTSIIHRPEKIRPYIITVSKGMQMEKYIEANQQDMPL